MPVPELGLGAWSPSIVHSLLIACAHRVAHHGDAGDLLWLYDIHLLARALGGAERDAFLDLASARQMRTVCARGLELASSAFGRIDVELIAELSKPTDRPEPAAIFVGGGLRPVDVLRSDLAAVGWPSRLRIIGEHLFPRAEFVHERFDTRTPLALPFLYARRLVSGLPKWLRR